MGSSTWFQPSSAVQRKAKTLESQLAEKQLAPVERGDVPHLDFGITAIGLKAKTLETMRTEKISGSVYTHPIGDHGHGAVPLIGLWDRQEGVPARDRACCQDCRAGIGRTRVVGRAGRRSCTGRRGQSRMGAAAAKESILVK